MLSNDGYNGAMTVRCGGFLIKRHQIAVALRVSNGGTMGTVIGLTVVQNYGYGGRNIFFKFSQNDKLGRLGLTRPNPKLGFGIKMR